MKDCDMVVFECSKQGTVQVSDMWSVGPFAPQIDKVSLDYTTFIDQQDGSFVKFTSKRKLNTNDPQDFVFPLGQEFVMSWAGCPCKSQMRYHCGNYGWLGVTLPTDGGNKALIKDISKDMYCKHCCK